MLGPWRTASKCRLFQQTVNSDNQRCPGNVWQTDKNEHTNISLVSPAEGTLGFLNCDGFQASSLKAICGQICFLRPSLLLFEQETCGRGKPEGRAQGRSQGPLAHC